MFFYVKTNLKNILKNKSYHNIKKTFNNPTMISRDLLSQTDKRTKNSPKTGI
jgi:hypothetical protein